MKQREQQRDEEVAEEAVKIDIADVCKRIEAYDGPGFETGIEHEMPIQEYFERLGADRGRYFGNIVHQGVRDHRGMGEHSGNMGVYRNEMKQVVQSGGMKSSVRRILDSAPLLEEAKKTVKNIQTTKKISLEDAIEQYVHESFVEGSMRHQQIEDKMAIHMSSNAIIDAHYGTETGNEHFVLFPETAVAKTHDFWSRATDTESRGTQFNDVYLWPKGEVENTLSLNGALIFVPRDNRVGKDTGSLYEVEDGSAVLDKEKIDRFVAHLPTIQKTKEVLRRVNVLNPEDVIAQGKDGWQVIDTAYSRLEKRQKEALKAYIQAVAAADLDPIAILDPLRWQAINASFKVERDAIEERIDEEAREEIRRYLDLALLHREFDSEDKIGAALKYYLDPEGLKLGWHDKMKTQLQERGFDIQILDRVSYDPDIRQSLLDFVTKYLGAYKKLSEISHGYFYKTPQDEELSSEHYNRFFRSQFSSVKTTTIQGEKETIVEYRGKDKGGKPLVLRVVFYTHQGPNMAIRECFRDLGIAFDDAVVETENYPDNILGDTEDFGDVKYRHDIEALKTSLAEENIV